MTVQLPFYKSESDAQIRHDLFLYETHLLSMRKVL